MKFNSGNPILDKNLEAIARYNPQLSEKILKFDKLLSQVELTETKLKEPNLTYNFIPLHSNDGAEKEIENVLDKVPNTKRSRHIVMGLGLGYLFKECCEKSKGMVFLYESNIEILRVTLELVDFSKELSQKNVFVASDEKFLIELIYTNVNYNLSYSILTLNTYKYLLYARDFSKIVEKINWTFATIKMNYTTCKNDEFPLVEAVFNNMPYLMQSTPLGEISDYYKDKTALIISAGPTLDNNIEIIKMNRDKVVIFCVGQAFKTLLHNDIRPDFINVLEAGNFSGQLEGCDLSNMNIILEPFTNHGFYQYKVKKRFLFISKIRNANKFFSKITDTDISKYWAKGTVSHQAMESAKILGCKKIILVGQDLAFIDNKCYASNSAYGSLNYKFNEKTGKTEFEKSNNNISGNDEIVESKVKIYGQHLSYVKGITGEKIPTLAGYVAFIEVFTSFAEENKDLELINTSMIGAQIDGFENMPLEQALSNTEIINDRFDKKDFKFDIPKVLVKLEEEKNTLKSLLQPLNITKRYIKEYEKEMKFRDEITQKAIKSIKALLAVYEEQIINQNLLYKASLFNEDIELMYLIDLIDSSKEFDNETIIKLYNLLKLFFENLENKLKKVIEKIDKTKGELSESINSESKTSKCYN